MIDWQHVVWDVGSLCPLFFQLFLSLFATLSLTHVPFLFISGSGSLTVLWFKIPLIALLWRCPPLFHCSYWYLHTATTSSPLPPPSPAPLCPSVSAVPELGPQSRHCTLNLREPAGSMATASSYKTDVASWWDCLREAKIAGEASVLLCKRKSDAHQQRHFSKRLHWPNTSIRWTSTVSRMGTQLSWRPLLFLPALQYSN